MIYKITRRRLVKNTLNPSVDAHHDLQDFPHLNSGPRHPETYQDPPKSPLIEPLWPLIVGNSGYLGDIRGYLGGPGTP